MISYSVYVVDDEPDLREGITAALERDYHEHSLCSLWGQVLYFDALELAPLCNLSFSPNIKIQVPADQLSIAHNTF